MSFVLKKDKIIVTNHKLFLLIKKLYKQEN